MSLAIPMSFLRFTRTFESEADFLGVDRGARVGVYHHELRPSVDVADSFERAVVSPDVLFVAEYDAALAADNTPDFSRRIRESLPTMRP
jgi:hypothetical protein